jgi:hypothetical protein
VTIAGHPFEDGWCSRCGRTLCDVLGYSEIAAVGAGGIACVGDLTEEELASLRSARSRQLEAVEKAMA